MASFNIFEPPTKCDIKVGYISTDRGYVSGVGIHDANLYAKKNPGTTFISVSYTHLTLPTKA